MNELENKTDKNENIEQLYSAIGEFVVKFEHTCHIE